MLRFQHIKRPYNLSDVQRTKLPIVRNSPGHQMARDFYGNLRKHQENKTADVTFGCLDAVQAVQMAPHVSSIYVSGWQTSSTTERPGPDLADYPYTAVPEKTRLVSSALEMHTEKARLNDGKSLLRPIVADADAGHGSLTATMKLTKLLIEAGAAGLHLEDQRSGSKRCGHLGGKVLVSTKEHCDRLIAARLQADLLDHDLVIISRTDAESASYIDNDIDVRDHPFIVGTTEYEEWEIDGTLPAIINKFRHDKGLGPLSLLGSLEDMKWAAIRDLPSDFRFTPIRNPDGYYKIKSGVDYAVQRALAAAPYSDLLWMETSKPCLDQAKVFSERIRERFPHMMLAYNLSPSFDWGGAFSGPEKDPKLRDFTFELAKLGFQWQFITLAGFHVNGLAMTKFARNYEKDGVLAYVRDVQNEEKAIAASTLKHQSWSGVDLSDHYLSLIGSKTAASGGHGNLENLMNKL